LELKENWEFILPGYSPYFSEPFYYVRFKVLGRIKIKDESGDWLHGWRVEGIRTSTLADAQSIENRKKGRYTVYFVSSDPPYFLGKEKYIRNQNDKESLVLKTQWRLTSFQLLTITPLNRMEEILRVRKDRASDQVIPWQ